MSTRAIFRSAGEHLKSFITRGVRKTPVDSGQWKFQP